MVPPSDKSRNVIRVTDTIAIGEDELSEAFIRASGPGGQNVNKVATAVQLRFDVGRSPSLPQAVKERLAKLAGARLTKGGEIVIEAQRFRTLERNRADALARLVALIGRAAATPKKRRPTRPTLASREERLKAKAKRSERKTARAKPGFDD